MPHLQALTGNCNWYFINGGPLSHPIELREVTSYALHYDIVRSLTLIQYISTLATINNIFHNTFP